MQTLLQDLLFGARMLFKNRGFTAVAVLTLALGIGANSAIFSVVNAVLLRPLPYAQPERLIKVWGSSVKAPHDEAPVSFPNYLDWRDQNRVFEQMAAYFTQPVNLTGTGAPERVLAAATSATLLPLLGVNPVLGRSFLREEDQPGGNKVVILSQRLWQRRYNADPNLVGKTVVIDGDLTTVVGIMAEDFKFPTAETELWVPLALSSNDPSAGRMSYFLDVMARLKPGVTVEQAQTEMDAIARQLEQQYPSSNTDARVNLVPLHEQVVGKIKAMLLVLLGAVGFVLLIACANVANLMLARATGRQKEIAVRMALGASRRHVIQQLFTESLLLSLLGGVFGLFFALWGIDLLMALSPDTLPRIAEVKINGLVLGFTFAVSILTGLLFGLVPALQVSKTDLLSALKETGRETSSGPRRQRVRSALAVTEIALALVLLIGAGLLLKSFFRLLDVNPGFDPQNVLAFNLSLSPTKYADNKQWENFLQQVTERVKALPGVQAVGMSSSLPFSGEDNRQLFYIEGRPHQGPQDYTGASNRVASPGYFPALGMKLEQGRNFTEQDRADAPRVVIINRAFAQRFFPHEEPLGKRFKQGTKPESKTPWLTVIGVVGDLKHSGLDEGTRAEFYLPFAQSPFPFVSLVVKTNGPPLNSMSAVRQAVWAIDPDQPISNAQTMEQLVAASVASRRFNMLLLGLFALLALVLATIGIYGVISYSVAQRTPEIGIRMALGAQPRDILKLVIGQGMALAVIGIVLGLVAALALTRLMQNLLYGVSATDPMVFTAIALLLAGIALLACYLPARRATKVDPMIALRYE